MFRTDHMLGGRRWVNVVCGQVGHAGMWATPPSYRGQYSELVNHEQLYSV